MNSRWRHLLVGVLLLAPMPIRAQAPVPPVTLVSPDSVRPSPLNYMLRSMVLPGWGQASLDRKLTGGLFMAFEGVALAMVLKSSAEMDHLKRTESERFDAKRQERQDWIVLLAANHLFAGLEAFVAANLFDFPGDLGARRMPDGRTGLGLTLPLPR